MLVRGLQKRMDEDPAKAAQLKNRLQQLLDAHFKTDTSNLVEK